MLTAHIGKWNVTDWQGNSSPGIFWAILKLFPKYLTGKTSPAGGVIREVARIKANISETTANLVWRIQFTKIALFPENFLAVIKGNLLRTVHHICHNCQGQYRQTCFTLTSDTSRLNACTRVCLAVVTHNTYGIHRDPRGYYGSTNYSKPSSISFRYSYYYTFQKIWMSPAPIITDFLPWNLP